jgi:hypothetical protein
LEEKSGQCHLGEKNWKKRKIEKKREYHGRIMGRLKLKPKGLSGEN